VGQGDSAVIESPSGRVVVVDGGGVPGTDERFGNGEPGSRVVVPFLRSRGISTVDLVVPTHPDDDHVQGLNAVVERLSVRGALDGGYPGASAPYTRLLDALHRRHIPLYTARRGQVIDLGGGAKMEVLGPTDHLLLGGHSATNNNSIVLRVVYGRARVLLTGDAEAEEETDLIASGRDISADVLKVGHHGSRWSSTDSFLDRVRPSIAVLSVGRNNTYGHPHGEVLERLRRRGVRVFRTDRDGAITLETDGKRIRIMRASRQP
jgi:competence protein ComEC